MMISGRLLVGWSFLWLGACLSCLVASAGSQTISDAELNAQLNEILSNQQNDTCVHLSVIVIYCSSFMPRAGIMF